MEQLEVALRKQLDETRTMNRNNNMVKDDGADTNSQAPDDSTEHNDIHVDPKE